MILENSIGFYRMAKDSIGFLIPENIVDLVRGFLNNTRTGNGCVPCKWGRLLS